METFCCLKQCSVVLTAFVRCSLFEIAHHFFSTHLIDYVTGKYHGMVCHYGQCPKRQKEVCRVPGCGEHKFVRVLPGFRLKPERLHTHNSQVLFERT